MRQVILCMLLFFLPLSMAVATFNNAHPLLKHHNEVLRTQRIYANVDRQPIDAGHLLEIKAIKAQIHKPFFSHYGLYISQRRFLDQSFLIALLERAQRVGIDTMIVDLYDFSDKYAQSVALLKKYHMHFIPKIDVFPQGGKSHQVEHDAFWQAHWANIQPYRVLDF